ncbi:MAG: hypothetical protein ACYTGG_07220 [Planctomycetota bacterium]|jgi:hypothetical protein
MSTAPISTSETTDSAAPAPPTRTRLKNHQARSRTTIHGWPAVCFGVPFFGVGVLMVLIWQGLVPVKPGSVHAPMWIIGLIGPIFGLPGLFLIWHGLDTVRRRGRARRMMLLRPHEPWLADYPWNTTGARDDGVRGIVACVLGLGYLAVFLVPFHWWAIAAGGGWFVGGLVGLFDLVLLLFAGQLIHRVLQRAKYGRSYLHYGAFPFVPGDVLEAVFDCPRGLGHVEQLTCTLRCVEEAYEERGTGDDRRAEVVCYEAYRDTFEVDEPAEHRGDRGMAVSFLLPQDALTTDLASRPPRYWEIEVLAESRGPDFKATFLVPVYEKA